MYSQFDEQGRKSLGIITKRVESARSEVADAATKIGGFRDDPLIEAARKDLLDAANQMAMAVRKLERASSPGDAARQARDADQPRTPTRRQVIEAECLKVIADARERHGDRICSPLGISPTIDPGLAMLGLYQRFQKDRMQDRPSDSPDAGDTLIGDFLSDLKTKVAAAVNQISEGVPALPPAVHRGFANAGRLGTGRGARTTDSRLGRGK